MRKPENPSVARCLLRSPAKCLLLLLEQAAARALAWLPVWLPFVWPGAGRVFPLSTLIGKSALVLLLYLLAVYPMRARAARQLAGLVCDGQAAESASYPLLILHGLARMLLGGTWGVPLALLTFRMYQYWFVFDGSRYSQDLEKLSALFMPNAPDANIGLYIYLGFMALAGLLLLYGWWRGMPHDFLMTRRVSPLQALGRVRAIRRRRRGRLWAGAALHMALCLLAVSAPAAILCCSLAPLMTGHVADDLPLLYFYFSGGMVENKTLLWALIAFIALYLPFLLYRKARNARVIVHADKSLR